MILEKKVIFSNSKYKLLMVSEYLGNKDYGDWHDLSTLRNVQAHASVDRKQRP